MRLSQAVSLLITEAKSRRLSPATVIFYEREFEKLVRELNDPDASKVTVNDLRAYIATVSPRSAPNAFKVIKRLFRFLTDEELLKKDPAGKLQRPKVQALVTKPLSPVQVKKCYDVVRSWPGYTGLRDAAIFALLVGTGMRREELCKLTDADVDLTSGTILINGKGQKQRVIPLPSKLLMILAKYQVLRSGCKFGRTNVPYFFRDRHGQQMTTSAVTQLIRRIAREVGFRVYPHLLRHTFCSTYMSHDGADVLALKELAGWSTLAMATVYVKPSMQKLQRSVETFSPVNDL